MKFIDKNFYFILLLFCILPYNYSSLFLNNFSNVINIITYLIRIVLIIYVVYYMKNLKLNISEKKTLKKITLYFIFIFGLNFISTLTGNYTNMSDLFIRSFSMIYMYGFYVYMIYNFKNINNFNKILKNVLSFLLIFSIILYVFFPVIGRFYEGFNSYTLLGVAANRNSYFELTVPLIVSILFLNENQKLSFFDKFLIVLVTITIFMTKSVTSIISLIVFFLILLFCNFKKIKLLKFITFLIVLVWVMDLIFICSNFDLSSFSSSFANKSTTMSGRTIIWQKTMYFFEQKPLIGYGYDNTIIGDTDNYIYQLDSNFPNDTHNSILFMLLSSGIIGTTVLIVLILDILKKGCQVVKYDNKYLFLVAFLLSMTIRGLAESCLHYPHLIFFLYLIFIDIRYNQLFKSEEI